MALQDIDVYVAVPNVDGWLNTLNDYANDAIRNAERVAASLSSLTISVDEPNVSFESVPSTVTIGALAKPVVPTPSTVVRAMPSAPTISAPNLITGDVPTFTVASPDVNLPVVPNPLDISLPVKDFIVDTSLDFPISPDTALPNVPTLLDLDLPVAQLLDLPVFNLDFPTSTSIVIPGITFAFSESNYSSPLLTKVTNELIDRLSTSTGLNTFVEEAIWNRGVDREARASVLAQTALLQDQASRGFSKPSGSVMASLENIVQETQSKIIDLSREIMIKQAELEQENAKSAIQQTIALEDLLIREHNNINQRAFEVAKYMQDIAVEIFKISISKYQSEVEAYKAFSSAYSAKVQAELSKIEIFKAEIDAQKLKGDINEQNIRIYLAQIEGVKSNVEVYKALIGAVSEKLKAEGLKIEVYKTDVEAYATAIKAKADEFGMYSEQIKGELAKVDIYDSQVKAFATRIQAYSSQSDVSIKRAETQVSIEALNIKKYEAAVDAFIKQVQADQLVYQSAVDLYRGEAAIHTANIGFNKAVADLELKNSENVILQNKYKADIGLSNAQIALEGIKSAYNAMISARQSAGSIYQAIGSSALSAINVSASLSGSATIGASESHNYSVTQ